MAFFDARLQHRWSLSVFEFRQKTTLALFSAFLKLAVDRWKLVIADPELQEKLRYYSFQRRLRLIEQLWEQDFRREVGILALKYKQEDARAVAEWLEGLAQKQEAPRPQEGYELFVWVDASGKLHRP